MPTPSDSPDTEGLDDQPEVITALRALRDRLEQLLTTHQRRLPPERQLASELGIGRNTVRRALAILERDGLIVRHVGRGTFITSGGGLALPQLHALTLQGALAIDASQGLSPRELLEVRYALEPAIAELAASCARPADILEMQECLRQREAASHLDAYERWDYALHMCIAKTTRNAMLIELLELVNRLRRTANWRQFRRASIHPGERRPSNEQHLAIVEAIARADPAAAFTAMRQHLRAVSGHFTHHTDSSSPNSRTDDDT